MKAVVAAFDQEKALVGAFSVITNLRMELFQALVKGVAQGAGWPGWLYTLHWVDWFREHELVPVPVPSIQYSGAAPLHDSYTRTTRAHTHAFAQPSLTNVIHRYLYLI